MSCDFKTYGPESPKRVKIFFFVKKHFTKVFLDAEQIVVSLTWMLGGWLGSLTS